VVVVGDPIGVDVSDLLQPSPEAETEVVRRLLRIAPTDRTEVGVVLRDDLLEAPPRLTT
jgi:hypothetical protein